MSFIMDLINKIFDKNSVKTLPNGNPQSEFTNEKRNRNWLLPKTNNKTPLNELETSIKRFLLAYNYILEKNPQAYNSNCQNLAYHALTGLNGVPPTQLEFQINAQNERNLLNYMRQNQKYNFTIQGSPNNPAFFHVKSAFHTLPSDQNLRRIYINCNSGNIASLTQKLLENNRNPNFYLKFCSNNSNARHSRGEKIVIYCDVSELNYVKSLIEYTKETNPELFKESDNLPFLPKLNENSSVSAEPLSKVFTHLNGQHSVIAKSANSVLTAVLRESYCESVKDISRNDPKLNFLLTEPFDEITAIKNFQYIDYNYHNYLFESIKAKMQLLSQKNQIYIDGLFDEQQKNNNINLRNTSQEHNR